MTALLDTNVIVDALQAREPWNKAAESIFLKAAGSIFIGCITAKSVTDIYYLCHRTLHDDARTRSLIAKLFQLFQVLDTAGTDTEKALASDISDYEDAVMMETALRNRCDCIVTRNTKDFSPSALPVYTPDEFLRVLPPARGSSFGR